MHDKSIFIIFLSDGLRDDPPALGISGLDEGNIVEHYESDSRPRSWVNAYRFLYSHLPQRPLNPAPPTAHNTVPPPLSRTPLSR